MIQGAAFRIRPQLRRINQMSHMRSTQRPAPAVVHSYWFECWRSRMELRDGVSAYRSIERRRDTDSASSSNNPREGYRHSRGTYT
jgi:hypothetical protein